MDTNVIIAIVVAVIVIAAIINGVWWFGKASKRSVERATDEAVAKGVQLATEDTEDTEHASNADADHAQHAEASAASAEKLKRRRSTRRNRLHLQQRPRLRNLPSRKPWWKPRKPPAPACSASRRACPSPAIRSARPCSTSSPRTSSPKPTGRTSKTPSLLADVGAEASEQLVEELRNDARIAGQSDPAEVRAALKDKLLKLVGTDVDRRLNADKEGANKPSVIIMVGVNGTGKTTTAGKLSRLLVSEGKQVMLGAADTFRAAAADQLETWGAKVGVPVVRSDKDGADPASVAFEASAKAKEENVDVLIIDTAGRLQNKANLMDELGKIRRVTEKNLPVDEVLLVLDATTGQNGMTQAKVFAEAIGITGVVLSKLDGSAKGGIVISVQKELGVPVKLVGLGEGPDDLAPFDPEGFVDGILA